MKRKFYLAGSLAFALALAKAQKGTEADIPVNESAISIVYNNYAQTGDNSAVTGGEGTERLTVYGPKFGISRRFGKNNLDFQVGVDIISSASTDNIDFIPSSASRLDGRTYSELSYTRLLQKAKLSITGGVNVSIESDYFSFGQFLELNKASNDDMQEYTFRFQFYNDDVRWGWLDGEFEPKRLIYPQELRGKEWFDEYLRRSYNFNAGFTQVLNERQILGIFALLNYQDGLLATPFHRVFFKDGTLRVENLPTHRLKAGLTLNWNYFVGGGIILKNSMSGYSDTFGINALAVEHETAFKLDPKWTLQPGARFYLQSESDFFAEKGQHEADAEFYSSDFDYSEFNTVRAGFAIIHRPFSFKKFALEQLTFRYSYFNRSNGLDAHTVSLVMDFINRNHGSNKSN